MRTCPEYLESIQMPLLISSPSIGFLNQILFSLTDQETSMSISLCLGRCMVEKWSDVGTLKCKDSLSTVSCYLDDNRLYANSARWLTVIESTPSVYILYAMSYHGVISYMSLLLISSLHLLFLRFSCEPKFFHCYCKYHSNTIM